MCGTRALKKEDGKSGENGDTSEHQDLRGGRAPGNADHLQPSDRADHGERLGGTLPMEMERKEDGGATGQEGTQQGLCLSSLGRNLGQSRPPPGATRLGGGVFPAQEQPGL